VVTAIRPSDGQTWLFENLLVFAVLPVLMFTYRKFQFSNLSYVLHGRDRRFLETCQAPNGSTVYLPRDYDANEWGAFGKLWEV
jgi:hypothetical protein